MKDFPLFVKKKIGKYGKETTNDYHVVDKFFNSMRDYHKILEEVPYSAVEELEKYESNRELIIKIIKRIFKICDAAKINLIEEISNMDANIFDGLEEDLALKKNKIQIEN